MKTECGLFAALAIKNKIMPDTVYNALASIQHRGQDSWGLLIFNYNELTDDRKQGLFPLSVEEISALKLMVHIEMPYFVIGHLRYATAKLVTTPTSTTSSFTEKITNSLKRFSLSGGRSSSNLTASVSSIDSNSTSIDENPLLSIQPVEISKEHCIYIAHNGNLANLRYNVGKLNVNSRLIYPTDTYLFKYIWEEEFSYNGTRDEIVEFIKHIIKNIPGAYSCVLSFYDKKTGIYSLFGFRDRYGYKPLSIGIVDRNNSEVGVEVGGAVDSGSYCFFSESVQLSNNCEFLGDVEPGAIYEIAGSAKGMTQQPKCIYKYYGPDMVKKPFFCSMEAIYFMDKGTKLFNGITTVHHFRYKLGMALAKQEYSHDFGIMDKIKKSVITYVPESAHSIAAGYAAFFCRNEASDLITKVENIRSFIESSTDSRNGKIKRKFAFNEEKIVKIDEIVLIDDSIVRGNTMIFIIQKLKEINPEIKIHLRIGAPMITDECHFGIDIASRDELVYTSSSPFAPSADTIRHYLGAASLEFLDVKIMEELFASYGSGACTYCFGSRDLPNEKCLDW